MKYMDSSDRFELIHAALARYGEISKKLCLAVDERRIWDSDVIAPGTNEHWRSLVRIVSMIDLMNADISLAIAESDNLDEEWYRNNNMGKEKAVGQLCKMQIALMLLLVDVEGTIEKAKKAKKAKRK